MKRNYKSMEAIKIKFDSREQVAAACSYVDLSSKYLNTMNNVEYCSLQAKENGEQFYFTADGSDNVAPFVIEPSLLYAGV